MIPCPKPGMGAEKAYPIGQHIPIYIAYIGEYSLLQPGLKTFAFVAYNNWLYFVKTKKYIYIYLFFVPLCQSTPIPNLYASADILGHLFLNNKDAARDKGGADLDSLSFSDFVLFFLLIAAAFMQVYNKGVFLLSSSTHCLSMLWSPWPD